MFSNHKLKEIYNTLNEKYNADEIILSMALIVGIKKVRNIQELNNKVVNTIENSKYLEKLIFSLENYITKHF